MKVLLIAYEFPPILAAQSLRWLHLANELIAMGVHLEVLCPDIVPNQAFPLPLDGRIITHRVWPGPFIGLGEYAAKRSASASSQRGKVSTPAKPSKLSLLSRTYGIARDVLNRVAYPDIRSEWYFFAKQKLKQLLAENQYNFVVSSHEPAVDIFLGFYARKNGTPWIVDLGDPLLTPYSPPWRRKLDLRVEKRVMQQANHVVVTDDKVIELLVHRHGEDLRPKFSTISQGFPATQTVAAGNVNACFTICFTGNFYSDFRNPEQLALALRALPDIAFELHIIGNNHRFAPLFEGIHGVHFLGQKNHADCLKWQRTSDLLINIGNVQNYQIPGKIYEYLGSNKPIFHIQTSENIDPGAELIEKTGTGIVVKNNAQDIAIALRNIYAQWQFRPDSLLVHRQEALIQSHTWKNKALLYSALLSRLGKSQTAPAHHRP